MECEKGVTGLFHFRQLIGQREDDRNFQFATQFDLSGQKDSGISQLGNKPSRCVFAGGRLLRYRFAREAYFLYSQSGCRRPVKGGKTLCENAARSGPRQQSDLNLFHSPLSLYFLLAFSEST